jgi:hypothetical protein
MTDDTRSERTARVLAARLDELARALELAGVPAGSSARLLEAASVATLHAVTLDLLTAERAAGLWQEAAERHPAVAILRNLPERIAA